MLEDSSWSLDTALSNGVRQTCSSQAFLSKGAGITGVPLKEAVLIVILLLLGLSGIIPSLCVFIELYITTQPGPAKVCYTYESYQWRVVCNYAPLKGTAGFL